MDMPLKMPLVDELIRIRRQICPKTSYATSGSAANELYLLSYSNNIEFINNFKNQILLSNEFDKISDITSNNLANDTISNHVVVIMIDGIIEHDIINNIHRLFIIKSLKLCYIVITKDNQVVINKIIDLIHSISYNNEICIKVNNNSMISIHSSNYINNNQINQYINELGFNNQPSVRSKQQFKFIWTNNNISSNDCKDRILQRLTSKNIINSLTNRLYTRNEWNDIIYNSCIVNNEDDYDIYNQIRKYTIGKYINESLLSSSIIKKEDNQNTNIDNEDGRANLMVKFICHCIPKYMRINNNKYKINKLLDYGCAEGAITASLGKQLDIIESNLYGADIRYIPSKGYTFIHLKSENEIFQHNITSYSNLLPDVIDHSIDVITVSMVLHHVTHINETLLELRRIISTNGCLILREHHCVSSEIAIFLDITHGLYSLAWSDPIEWPDFINEYQAYYRNKYEWNELLFKNGFKLYNCQDCSYDACKLYNISDDVIARKKDGTIPNVILAYYATYIPDPDFIFPSIELKNKRKLNVYEEVDEQVESTIDNEVVIYESKKFRGSFYMLDQLTNEAVWVKLNDNKYCINPKNNQKFKIKSIVHVQ